LESLAAWIEVFAVLADGADFAGDRFFADFDIEILHSVHGGVMPHHRSPTAAVTPAGQDLRAPPGARGASHYRSVWSRSPVYLQRVFGQISPVSGIDPIVRRQDANRPEAVLMMPIIVLTIAAALANDDKGS
jgi:hypothetical protein